MRASVIARDVPSDDTERTAHEKRMRDGLAMHAIEGNPLDADDIAMFELFEREKLTPDERRAYILEKARERSVALAVG